MSLYPHGSTLHAYIHARFREAFGQPTTTLQQDDHWAFQSFPSNNVINVLLNGTPAAPAVWIFDPHVVGQQVFNATMGSESQVDDVIRNIQTRVKQAQNAASADPKA